MKCSAMVNVSLPALIDYVAFYQRVSVPHRSPEEGMSGNLTSWVVCDIWGLSLDIRLCRCLSSSSLPLFFLHKKGLHLLFFMASPLRPLQADMCLYKTHLLRSDMLSLAWRISPKTSLYHAWNVLTAGPLWTFVLRIKAVESLMTHSWPAHLTTGATLEMKKCRNTMVLNSLI